MGGTRRVVVGAVASWMLLLAPAAVWAQPCGGIQLDGGQVKTATPLPAKAQLAGPDLACAQAVATMLHARTQVRSITLAVRAAPERRTEAAPVVATWLATLTGAGIPAARISAIQPIGAPGSGLDVGLAYREPARRPVALVQALTGRVVYATAGAGDTAATKGTTLVQGDEVGTEKDAAARLALADGSFLALMASARIRLGRVELTEQLKRAVKIDLLRGKVEVVAEPQGVGSSFDVATRTAVAGVRGTRFRMDLRDDGATGVQTLVGKVELAALVGSKGAVLVEAGYSAQVEADGRISGPRALLPEPVITAPLSGTIARGGTLQWQPVPGAARYLVELATDGELVVDLVALDARGPSLALPAKLPAGHWFWRALAVDVGGVAGMPSKTYSFSLGAP